MSPALREKILAYMRQEKPNSRGEFCTWWFKFHVSGARDTKEIHRELESMERDGLVTSDHGQRNNTKWRLVEQGGKPGV